MQRRDFLTGLAAASVTASSALARGPIPRSGPPRLSLGLAAYSLRNYFEYSRGKKQEVPEDNREIDMFGFLDYCVAQGFDAAELTSYFFPPECDNEYLLSLRHAAFIRGLAISGTAIGNNFTLGKGQRLDDEIAQAKEWIDRAAILGAPHIRLFAGTARDLDKDTSRLDEAIDALGECAAHAATKGVFIGVENHGNLTATNMLEIMRRLDSPWIGINLDTGNFHSETPYSDIAACAPYAVNVQVKTSMKTPDGKTYPADFNRIVKILKDNDYQGFVILEYEEESPYENIPKVHQQLRLALAD